MFVEKIIIQCVYIVYICFGYLAIHMLFRIVYWSLCYGVILPEIVIAIYVEIVL